LDLLKENENKNPGEGIPFYDLFKLENHSRLLESLININTDVFSYISSKNKGEGADEASKFYHRNLVVFSNLNQIQLNPKDRICMLMGGSLADFFMDFLKRIPKYKIKNTFEYLR
jgi:hypothetical protein